MRRELLALILAISLFVGIAHRNYRPVIPNVHSEAKPQRSGRYTLGPRGPIMSRDAHIKPVDNKPTPSIAFSASPTKEHETKATPTGNLPRPHFCDDGPSISALSAGSPLVSDCRTLINNLNASDDNSHKWNSCRQHALASYKSCVFGIEHIPPNKCFPYYTLETGDGDIIDWLQDSIDTWGVVVGDDQQERVGTWGISEGHNIGFFGNENYLPVKWGVYHSDGVEDFVSGTPGQE